MYAYVVRLDFAELAGKTRVRASVLGVSRSLLQLSLQTYLANGL
jgi:hypothetical protein